MRKTLVGAAAFAFATAVAAGVAGAAPQQVTICHGTASATHPYVVITVADASFKDGHFDDGTAPSHGQKNQPDLLLASDGTCSTDGGGGQQ